MRAACAGVVMIACCLGATANAGGPEFSAKMSGDQEVPPVLTDAEGRFQIEFDRELTEGKFRLRLTDAVRITQAHIHCGPVGVNGPIVAFLAGFHNRGWDVDGKWIDNATLTDANVIPNPTPTEACPKVIETLADLVQAMRDGFTYANAHSIDNPAGEVRGQIRRDKD